jgi:hypothetical protein
VTRILLPSLIQVRPLDLKVKPSQVLVWVCRPYVRFNHLLNEFEAWMLSEPEVLASPNFRRFKNPLMFPWKA